MLIQSVKRHSINSQRDSQAITTQHEDCMPSCKAPSPSCPPLPCRECVVVFHRTSVEGQSPSLYQLPSIRPHGGRQQTQHQQPATRHEERLTAHRTSARAECIACPLQQCTRRGWQAVALSAVEAPPGQHSSQTQLKCL